MKLKDFYKLKRDIRDDQVNKYLKDNNIPRSFYDEGERKDKNLAIGLLCGLGVVLLSILAFSSCSVRDVKVTTPVVNEMGLRNEGPLRAFTPTKNIELNNMSTTPVYYSLAGEYNGRVQSNSLVYMPIQGSGDRVMYFEADNHQVYYLSDDLNFIGYNDEFQTNEELFNGSFINFYDQLNNDFYLNLNSARLDGVESVWLYGEMLNTGVSRTFTKDYVLPVYNVDFKQEYINHYNTFNAIRVTADIRVRNYTYSYVSKIYARNSTTNTNVLLAANIQSVNSSVVVNGNNLDVLGSSDNFGDMYYVAPYLGSLKLHTNSAFNPNNILTLRPWLSNTSKSYSYINVPTSDGDSEQLWTSIGDLIKITFISLFPLGEIYILPMVTIGALIVTPIIVAFIMLIIRILRK